MVSFVLIKLTSASNTREPSFHILKWEESGDGGLFLMEGCHCLFVLMPFV